MIKYRSSLELGISKALDKQGIAYRFEADRLGFIDPRTKLRHNWTPDFTFKGSFTVIEAKGYLSREERYKFRLLKGIYPDIDIRFIFQDSSKQLKPRSKGTYKSWCRRSGFKCSDGGLLPDRWAQDVVEQQQKRKQQH